MKLPRFTWLPIAAFALAGGFSAAAQSTGAPAGTDYTKFSQFISDRNIFDPNRVPRYHPTTTHVHTHTHSHSVGAPYVTFVGTMSYEKGLFAFFDSNDADNKKILEAGEDVAGYHVKAIGTDMVTLVGPGKKELSMKMGDQLHKDGGGWQLSGHVEDFGSSSEPPPAAETGNSGGNSGDTAPAAPSSNLEANDVLKRLMQLREKENQ